MTLDTWINQYKTTTCIKSQPLKIKSGNVEMTRISIEKHCIVATHCSYHNKNVTLFTNKLDNIILPRRQASDNEKVKQAN